MPSTAINAWSYDADARRLDIEFVTGRRYSYHDVPGEIATAMAAARSRGGFFNRRVRDRFAFTRRR